MRTLLAAVAAAVLVVAAQPATAQPPTPNVTLKVGDPAPALKADAWLQGDEVKTFETGKVYVAEFWATWCGPCIVMMPHLAEMQAEYKDKGVTFVGFTSKDPNNSKEKVVAFVKKRGPKLGYTFAYADTRATNDAWMKAAGRNGIPCCFVVGKDGKIAYIGHPMYLDVVLPKVVDGTWKGADSADELKKVEDDVNAMFRSVNNPDAAAGLAAVASFDAKYPALGHIPYFTGPKLNLLLKAGKIDEAKKMATEELAKAEKYDDSNAMRTIATALQAPAAKNHKELVNMSVKAALGMLKINGDKDLNSLMAVAGAYNSSGDKDKAKEYGQKAVTMAEAQVKASGGKNLNTLITAAEAHFAAGDKAKAKEYGQKAVDAATPQQKAAVERMVKKYSDEN